ncbi:tetratricopeptide repeat protein [Planctomycetota bacterium]
MHEDYPDPATLSELVLNDLKAVIDKQFPKEEIPDSLVREAHSHEYFAEIRRRTYIGRDDYFKTLDRHIESDGGPLVVLGDSGSGKTALLAKWIAHWRKEHPGDFIFQHYIGSTPDSADHWRLMRRLMAEIKQWSDDPDELPTSHDDILRDFRLWLSKARLKAQWDSVRCILILDALNQLEDQDNSRLLGWLPPDAFSGPLRLIVSTLPGDTLNAVQKYGWETLHIEKLTENERRRMIVDYLKRFGKKLDPAPIDRIIAVPATANPLYLKILLDELRITGTYENLPERLDTYLAEPDIPSLLKNVLTRYQDDYEGDRKGLVKEALGLIFSARRGLTEKELLELLRPDDLDQLPPAIWTPLRAAMEELLIDRGGILNFAHDFLRTAVEEIFVPDSSDKDDFRLWLADYFEKLPISTRSCDELPWLLWQTESFTRLQTCLLDIDCFLEIFERDRDELLSYWVGLGEETVMGKAYLESFERWSGKYDSKHTYIAYAANQIAYFLENAALHAEAEPLYRRALSIREKSFGKDHPDVAGDFNNLAALLSRTNRMAEAEPLYRRALSIYEKSFGKEHPNVAMSLNNLASLLNDTNRMAEAEPLYRRALSIDEKSFGEDHPDVASDLNNLASLLGATNRMAEAEPLYRRALSIYENSFGVDHPDVALALNNLAGLLLDTNRMNEAEPLYRRALSISEKSLGKDHPGVATVLNSLASLLQDTNRTAEAEPLYRRALSIDEESFGKEHPHVARDLSNLALLLMDTNRMEEAEPLMRRALRISEKSFGQEHFEVATHLNNLAKLLRATNRLAEAEPLIRRALIICENSLGKEHPEVATNLNNLALLLENKNRMAEAELLYRRALSIEEKSFGKEHPDVAISLNNLAGLLYATNRMTEAERLYRRALSIKEKSFGKEHPDVAISLNNLALLLKATNRMDEAEPLMRTALSILTHFDRITEYQHPDLQTFVDNYADLLQEMGYNQEQIMTSLRELGLNMSGG